MKISVCIATHNGERYVVEQLRSILPQLGPSDEVIVSDDGSSDKTLQKIVSLADSRIKVVHYEHEVPSRFPLDYATHNFSNALRHSSGDVIFFSDQDDVWLPGHVSEMMRELEQCDMVVCDCRLTDENLCVTIASKFQHLHVRRGILRNLWRNNCYQGSCMAFRREVYAYAQPFPPHYVGHDLWLGLIAEARFRGRLLPVPLLLYRRQSGSITFTGMKNTNTLLFKLRYRCIVVFEFIRRILKKRGYND